MPAVAGLRQNWGRGANQGGGLEGGGVGGGGVMRLDVKNVAHGLLFCVFCVR